MPGPSHLVPRLPHHHHHLDPLHPDSAPPSTCPRRHRRRAHHPARHRRTRPGLAQGLGTPRPTRLRSKGPRRPPREHLDRQLAQGRPRKTLGRRGPGHRRRQRGVGKAQGVRPGRPSLLARQVRLSSLALAPFSLQHLTHDRPCSQELPPRRLRHPRQRLLRRPLALLVGRVPAQQRPALPLVRPLTPSPRPYRIRTTLTRTSRARRRALAFPLLGMIFDALDGKVARWRRESSMLGQELDSLADSVRGFSALPLGAPLAAG